MFMAAALNRFDKVPAKKGFILSPRINVFGGTGIFASNEAYLSPSMMMVQMYDQRFRIPGPQGHRSNL